jgi:type II secretory pathway component PulF
MPQPTLDEFMAFNDQLAALLDAGVPMETGLGEQTTPAAEFQSINAVVARRVSQGASLDQALEDSGAGPPLYRHLVRVGLRTGNLASALRAANQLAESREESRQAATFALVYPAVILFLAYLGLVGFCLLLVPTLQNMYQSMGLRPRLTLNALSALRQTLPYWIALPPLGLAIGLALARRRSHRAAVDLAHRRTLASGRWTTHAIGQASNFSHSLATLLENGVPPGEALSIAEGSPANALAANHLSQSQAVFPPFLNWALFESEPAVNRVAALRTAADVYRSFAQRRLARWRVVAPIVFCILIGGSVVLLYGLVLFTPLIDMLQGLAAVPDEITH